MILDIWNSFRRMPVWVQIWVAVILVPVNIATLAFVNQTNGIWIAILAIVGMLPNLFFMIQERGFSKKMALPHVAFWTPLLLLIVMALMNGAATGAYASFLILLFIVDAVSLMFDFPDSWKWFHGDREIS